MFWNRHSRLRRRFEDELRSEDAGIRGNATQWLVQEAKIRPEIREWALPLFEETAAAARDPLSATYAAVGIEELAGADAARRWWMPLLQHADDRFAASAAFAVTHPSYAPDLLEMLDATRGRSARVREAAIRGLGKLKHPASLATIVSHLSDRATLPAAILALGQLEDPAAIPHLEPLLQDESPAAMTDDRGVPLQIADLAGSAVRRLRYLAGSG